MKDTYEAWHIRAEQAWLAEIERRITALDSGTVQSIPWEQLRARLYRSSMNAGGRVLNHPSRKSGLAHSDPNIL